MPFNSETIVVIPTMNRATLVVNALDAILKQTLQPDCLVVVDDGSTDNSLEVIRNWKTRTSPPFETKLIALPYNMGASVARNIGFAQARSNHRYVYFLDSDDIPPPYFLQHTTAALNQRPDAVAVTTDALWIALTTDPIKDQGRVAKMRYCGFHSNAHIATIKEKASWLPVLTTSGGLISFSLWRASAARQFSGFNETYLDAEDDEFLLRMFDLGHWLYVSTYPGWHCGHKSQLSQVYQDTWRHHAHLFENWMKDYKKRDAVFPPNLRTFLAILWTRAGWQLFFSRNHRYGIKETTDCLRRAWAIILADFPFRSSALFFCRFMFIFSFGLLARKFEWVRIIIRPIKKSTAFKKVFLN